MSVKDFKQSCEVLSFEFAFEFAKIDKRSRSIANLRNGNVVKKSLVGGVWLPCCRPGVPCSIRIMVPFTSVDVSKYKSLIIACSEVKYCLLSTKV